jgi:hypothetical protein
MNGRLYDAKLHRFLQPDNYVQDPSNTQNYNRYSYVLNNPLKYTDPSGESWWSNNWKTVVTVVAAVATAVVIVASMGTATPLVAAAWAGAGAGFVGGSLGTALGGGSFGESMLSGFTGAATGAIFGVAGAYVSTAIGAVGIIPGMLSGAATSTTIGGLANIMAGKDWDNNIGFNAAIGATGGGLAGFSAARASGSGIWFGTAVKPPATVIAGNINAATKEAQVAYDKSIRSQTEPTNMGNTTQTSDLSPTQFITKSKTQMTNLVNDIKINGIQEPISFTKANGLNNIVDGHHRYYAAKSLGIKNIPSVEVQLPFKGYQNINSLILEGKQPVWWKYFNPNK